MEQGPKAEGSAEVAASLGHIERVREEIIDASG